MYLKRLDLLGFKSFAQKTTVLFSSGVTAIVGPNGCGKTNVLDSLRWVLGEQRASLLRGGKMEEVIFNGSQDLKPLGMSEVTLTVVNDRGVLPTEYTEIQVTRRLFRSGESEYLLNKVPCRLKDITELFVDTGMGAHSYSVIQQDMVDAILSDKAEERRFLFEEAAGITKYKQRKRAALRKLEATEQDFLRLKDIHAEVRTQVNSLYRQHKKAERYQRVVDDIKAWDLHLTSQRIRALETERRELQATLETRGDSRQECDTQLSQANAELESARKEQIDLEHQLSDVGSQIFQITEQVHENEREISVAREKRTNADRLIEKNEQEIAAIRQRRSLLEGQRDEYAQLQTSAEQAVSHYEQDLAEAEKQLGEADAQLLSVRKVKDDENQKLLELEGRLSSGKTEESSLREQEEELASALQAVESSIAINSPLQSKLITELETRQQQFDEMNARRQELMRRREELSGSLETSLARSEELSEEISGLTASVEACEARRNLLEEMMLHYEGHGAGVVAVMEQRERWPSIIGTVGDLFVPVEGMETALERALGDLAGCVVCRDRKTAGEIIDWLKQEARGQVSILVPDPPTLNPAVKRPDMGQTGLIGWMDELVTVPEELVHLKQAVLARVAVFEADLDPETVLPHLPFGFAAVTTDGLVFRGNLMAGGSEESFPIFRRKERIQQQGNIIEELQGKLTRLRDEKNRGTAHQAEMRAESAELASKLEALAEDTDELQKRLGEVDYERRTLVSEFERLEKERNELSRKLESIRNRQTSLGLDYGQLAALKEEIVGSLESTGSKVENYERRSSEAADRVSRAQVTLIEGRSKIEQILGQIRHTRDILDELGATESLRTQEIETARQEITRCNATIAELESQLTELFQQREKLNERQDSLRGVQNDIMEQVTVREKRIKAIREGRETIGDEIHQLEIRINTLHNEAGSVRSRILDEYEVDVMVVDAERPDEHLDDRQAAEHLNQQKEKLKKFGAVNLLALEEYRTASERETFLREQIADLESAKNDLQATISKINATARQMFSDTFTKARENFQGLFVELFSGGEADIALTDPSDPLESPIEITARPRGKKLLSIAQMSGGERALTAISLLFALYLVKPSPFCILDEIDAPLDDANCHRFLKMIRNFSGQTQFVVITHNKITMEAADNLYGITMELPGVSRLVAVRFNDGGELIDQAEAPKTETSDDLPEAIKDRITPTVVVGSDEDPGQ